jgi:PAS domain S-box-containing protein
VALISLVDASATEQHQFFKSTQGLIGPLAGAPYSELAHALCQQVITTDSILCISHGAEAAGQIADVPAPMMVSDAMTALGVMAYLGVPLHASNRRTIGVLCVLDPAPHEWQAHDITTLRELAAIVEDEVALRIHLQRRTEAEIEVRQSEQRLRDVIDNLFSFVGLMTADGTLLEANQTALQAAALQPEDVLGKPFADTYWWSFSPESQARLRAAIARAAAGEQIRYDVPVRVAEDRYIVIDFTLAPIFDEAGSVTHLVPSGLDITERKAAEAALREGERRFRTTFENAAVGIAHVGLDGRWLQVNQRLCTIVGYAAHELHERTFQAITHPDDLATDLANLEALLRGKIQHYQIEKRYFDKAGRIVWINLTVTLQHDAKGDPAYFISIVEDISVRKAVEARLQLLAQASTMLVSSLDYAQTVQQVAELITIWFADWCAVDLVTADGLLETIAVAHQDRDAFALLRQTRPQTVQQLRPHRGRGKVLLTNESEFYPQLNDAVLTEVAHDDAHLQNLRLINPASVLIVPLRIRERTVGTVTMTRTEASRPYSEEELHFAEDLAGRIAQSIDNVQLYREARAAEADLRALNETLEEQVTERTKKLAQRNQELDRFAYIASHDLKAPLRAIDNLATWITEDAAALLPAPSQTHLTKLRDRVARMEKLLNDLLAYSRADRHRGAPEQVDSNQLVREVAALIAPPTFVIDVPAPLPTLVTLRVPLETVLRNLLGNAIKHHSRPTGRVVVTAQEIAEESAQENVQRSAKESAKESAAPPFIVFSITDDGPGIDPAYHERIFEIFETLQPRDQVEGSGVGLSIVKKIVESHGGAIVVASTLGSGATFRFTWPKTLFVVDDL